MYEISRIHEVTITSRSGSPCFLLFTYFYVCIQANFLCDFHPSTCKGNARLGSFCILETSFSFLYEFWHFEFEFQQFSKDCHQLFHQNLHISHVFQTTYPKDWLEMASNHTKTSFSSTNLHKNAGKMSFVRNKIEFCNKIRVPAFLVKSSFPEKAQKACNSEIITQLTGWVILHHHLTWMRYRCPSNDRIEPV